MDYLKQLLNLKIFKFLGVGGFCAGLSLVLMYVFTSLLDINYLISTVITLLLTNFIGFCLNKYITFQTGDNQFWRELKKYYGVMLSSYFINISIMYVLVDWISIYYLYATMIVIVILTPFNYFCHKNWSFKGNTVPTNINLHKHRQDNSSTVKKS